MGGFVTTRADWGSMLDAIYGGIPDEQRWAETVHEAARKVFRSSHGAGFSIVRHSAGCETGRFEALAMDTMAREVFRMNDDGLAFLGVEGFRRYFYPSGLMATHLEIEQDVPAEVAAAARAMRAEKGVGDAIGVFSYPEPGRVATLYAMHDGPIVLSHHERELLARVALHIDAALRLRIAPERVCAVLDARGTLLRREGDEAGLEQIGKRVARMSSRTALLDLWSALVNGERSLVRRRENGKTVFLVLENPPKQRGLRALSDGEAAAVAESARGVPTKLVGYALGVSPGVVSARLASAAAKLGVASRPELLRVAAMLTRDPRAAFPKVDLTSAEREILALLQEGLSNDEIARHRARSLRTIANQVAALLRKTNSPSRRALLVAG